MARRPPGRRLGRPSDLPPASILGLRHKHGTKMRYLSGCHCWRCRRGNADYEARLNRNRKLYGPNDLVSAERVLAHLRYLQTFGMGHKTVARHARVGKSSLAEIIWYGKQHLRRRNEARILAVRPSLDTLPSSAKIPAGPTVEALRQLLRAGYPKYLVNRDALGNSVPGQLQIHSLEGKTSSIQVKTVIRIRRFHALVAAMRRVWQEHRGAIPSRHYVYWKRRPGRRPFAPTIAWLELRRFAVTYDYNYVWPKELREASSLNNRIRKAIQKRAK
jgi:hypothetical protein